MNRFESNRDHPNNGGYHQEWKHPKDFRPPRCVGFLWMDAVKLGESKLW